MKCVISVPLQKSVRNLKYKSPCKLISVINSTLNMIYGHQPILGSCFAVVMQKDVGPNKCSADVNVNVLFHRVFFRIGGAVPIVFSYFAEFLAREKRGEHLSWLCMFWMVGGIYASAMAWAIIPHYGE